MVNFDVDSLVSVAGGRFRLATLVQRRMRELQRGLPPLVDKQESLMLTAVEELRQGKLWLATGDEAANLREERTAELQASAASPAAATPALPGASALTRKPSE
jgi:DNA-directed RNA polymerase subunit K/omega